MKYINPILAVADIKRSMQFYTEALGFSVQFTMNGADGELVHASLMNGEAGLMLAQKLNPGDVVGHGVVLYMTLNDDVNVDAAFTRAIAAGAVPTQEPTDQVWGMRDWMVSDPDGYQLQVGVVTGEVSVEEMQAAMATAG